MCGGWWLVKFCVCLCGSIRPDKGGREISAQNVGRQEKWGENYAILPWPREKSSYFHCRSKCENWLEVPVCVSSCFCGAVYLSPPLPTQVSGDIDSSIKRIWDDKMNHINEDHNLLTPPLVFFLLLPSIFYFLCSCGEPAQRLNCHCTVRPWQAALIHNAVPPLLIRGVGGGWGGVG